jgi:hypothetical protein
VDDNKVNLIEEPMWPSLVALTAAGGLHTAMPVELAVGTPYLTLGLVIGLMVPGEIFHKLGKHRACRIIGYTVLSLITISMILSVVLHVQALAFKTLPPVRLLGSAIILWITNILVFACWYWRLDAGGPHKRRAREAHTTGAFLFPQMAMAASSTSPEETEYWRNWSPQFVDYLFLSFNTSTALSPTDVPVLSRWAKALMMVQASVSLTVVVLLAARAVNIL